MPTPSQRLSIYFTAYCCLDGEECDLTDKGIYTLMRAQGVDFIGLLPELWDLVNSWMIIPPGRPGWEQRKEVLRKAMEVICKK